MIAIKFLLYGNGKVAFIEQVKILCKDGISLRSSCNISIAFKHFHQFRYFSGEPHLASSKRNTKLIHEIHRRFILYGFNATYHPYKVLLAYPNSTKPNKVSIIDEKGNASYTSKGIEDFLESTEEIAKDYPSFNGYAPSGTAEV